MDTYLPQLYIIQALLKDFTECDNIYSNLLNHCNTHINFCEHHDVWKGEQEAEVRVYLIEIEATLLRIYTETLNRCITVRQKVFSLFDEYPELHDIVQTHFIDYENNLNLNPLRELKILNDTLQEIRVLLGVRMVAKEYIKTK